MDSKPKILLLGESGSGKNTVQDFLVKKYGLKPLLSYTTRKRRYPDEDTHTFITEEEYNKIAKNEKVIASTRFDNNYYCATDKQLEQSDVYIIDVNGLQNLSDAKINGEIDCPLVKVYIRLPEKERIKRMKNRGDSKQSISQRIEHDKNAFGCVEYLCNYIFDNVDSENTADQIYQTVYGDKNVTQIDENKVLDTSKKIIDMLSQIQTLLLDISPKTTSITIELDNCEKTPLSCDNNFWITCDNEITVSTTMEIRTVNDKHNKHLNCTIYNEQNGTNKNNAFNIETQIR